MSSDKPKGEQSKYWRYAAIVLFAAFVGYVVFQALGDGDGEAEVEGGTPVEFLYLDTGRVASYIAQVSGGSFDQQKVTRKLTDNVDAKVVLTGLGEVGGGRAREVFLERILKPTDASNFFVLEDSLEGEEGELEELGLRDFKKLEDVDEGQMVRFETEALLSPVYLNPYLAVRHANTLEAMFPESAERRQVSKAFYEDVGENPRVVFALRPARPQETGGERLPFKYLLPMTANGLTKERSLFKNGGGQFTVVGKLVRRLPQGGREYNPAYVDSPTRETWEQPLLDAPGELLCRTEPKCIGRVREEDLEGEDRERAIRKTRRQIVRALKRQTTIAERGAVILPVAIYK